MENCRAPTVPHKWPNIQFFCCLFLHVSQNLYSFFLECNVSLARGSCEGLPIIGNLIETVDCVSCTTKGRGTHNLWPLFPAEGRIPWVTKYLHSSGDKWGHYVRPLFLTYCYMTPNPAHHGVISLKWPRKYSKQTPNAYMQLLPEKCLASLWENKHILLISNHVKYKQFTYTYIHTGPHNLL